MPVTELATLTSPTLIVWGEQDPWLAPRFAHAYAAALPAAELALIPEAGHWPWLESPAVIDRVTAFLAFRAIALSRCLSPVPRRHHECPARAPDRAPEPTDPPPRS